MKKCGICEKEIAMTKTYCSRACAAKAFRKTIQPMTPEGKKKRALEVNLNFSTGYGRER